MYEDIVKAAQEAVAGPKPRLVPQLSRDGCTTPGCVLYPNGLCIVYKGLSQAFLHELCEHVLPERVSMLSTACLIVCMVLK